MALVSLTDNFKMEKIERTYQQTGFSQSFLLKDKEEIVKVAGSFKSEEYFLETITAFDKADGIRMLYVFNKQGNVDRNVVYLDAAYEEELVSLTGVYEAAVWFESEVFDMFGNTFKGHPCLKRLLTPEGFKGFPLLKTWKPEEV
jgi:NADH-quinone oxidoreductase subunit C